SPQSLNIQLPQAGVAAKAPYLYLIALNEPMSGKMGGISGIDHKCWKQSRQAGLRGTYRAFLSSYAQAIKSIVRRRDRDLPVANRN
ncbi:Collagen alpha-1(XXIV) chain, partial [Paramuricea clavata]